MIFVPFIIFQVLVMGAVVLWLKKMMVSNTRSAVNRLNTSYEEISKKKEELEQKLQQAEEEYQAKKKEAEEIAKKLKEDAEIEINKREVEVLKKARQEAEKIIVDTENAREAIIKEIRKEERMKTTEYCSELMQEAFRASVREEMDAILIKSFLEEFQNIDISHMPSTLNEVEITTRIPLKDKDREEISKIIKRKMDREIQINSSEDENIVGGIVLKFGSLVLDGSIAGKLKEHASEAKDRIDKER